MKRFFCALVLFLALLGLTTLNLRYTNQAISQLIEEAKPILEMSDSEGADALSHLAKTWDEKRSVLSLFLHESSVEAVNAALAESLSFAETEKPDEAKASLRQVIIFLTELREREHPNLGNIF